MAGGACPGWVTRRRDQTARSPFEARGEGVIQIARLRPSTRAAPAATRASLDAPNRRLALGLDTRAVGISDAARSVLARRRMAETTGATPTKRARRTMAYDEAREARALPVATTESAYMADQLDGTTALGLGRDVCTCEHCPLRRYGEVVPVGLPHLRLPTAFCRRDGDDLDRDARQPGARPPRTSRWPTTQRLSTSSCSAACCARRSGDDSLRRHMDVGRRHLDKLTPAASPHRARPTRWRMTPERQSDPLPAEATSCPTRTKPAAWDGATWTLLTPIQAPSAPVRVGGGRFVPGRRLPCSGGGQSTPFGRDDGAGTEPAGRLLTAPTKPDQATTASRARTTQSVNCRRHRHARRPPTSRTPGTITQWRRVRDRHRLRDRLCVDGVCCESASCGLPSSTIWPEKLASVRQ